MNHRRGCNSWEIRVEVSCTALALHTEINGLSHEAPLLTSSPTGNLMGGGAHGLTFNSRTNAPGFCAAWILTYKCLPEQSCEGSGAGEQLSSYREKKPNISKDAQHPFPSFPVSPLKAMSSNF